MKEGEAALIQSVVGGQNPPWVVHLPAPTSSRNGDINAIVLRPSFRGWVAMHLFPCESILTDAARWAI